MISVINDIDSYLDNLAKCPKIELARHAELELSKKKVIDFERGQGELSKALNYLGSLQRQGESVRNRQHAEVNAIVFMKELIEVSQGWLNYAVPPLAIAQPLEETAQLNLKIPH